MFTFVGFVLFLYVKSYMVFFLDNYKFLIDHYTYYTCKKYDSLNRSLFYQYV